ncbi:MAG: PhzF family phenazine biosynthesis protein [Pseudomonadaceae bacterium]|nr:PhzF family phenazine biosynthesis protein [Pseudomonadaceae bacterium]
MKYPLEIVDVFAEQPLAGNQLAVVRDAGTLTTAQMQDIAREMNFSETTFVIAEDEAGADVRIFTPEWELPFAGHPTIGTSWVLRDGRDDLTLRLPIGDVPVSFSEDAAWMVPPEVSLGSTLAPEHAAGVLGLKEADLATAYPIQFAEVGPQFVLIGVRDRGALGRCEFNYPLYKQLLEQGNPMKCVFAFTDDAHNDGSDFAARMFFDSGGPREDAATGSANTAFAAYLRALKGLSGTGESYVVEQGVEMKRPSRLYLDVGDVIRVGGAVQSVVRGELTI